MRFNLTGTLDDGEVVPGVTGPITSPSFEVSADDLALIMAAVGANPQTLGVSPNNAVALATPAGVLAAVAAKIASDLARLTTSYQHHQAAQAAIAAVKPISIAQVQL